ncbi:MAG: APC family permease [Clostridia bacterium]|nr:APC family permease [Clostridia bacterium]
MGEKLTKKYGLFTAIALVVGVVIGSGVFFKAQDILNYTNGNMTLGIAAWAIGAAVMIVCALAFAFMASKYEKVNGVVDYAETTCGKKYAYMIAWFLSTIYYPAMTSVLAWVSARFTCVVLGIDNPLGGTECLVIATFYLVASFAINTLSPKLAGKFQVSTTVIKLIPLALMIVVGIIVGLTNGNVQQSFNMEVAKGSGGSVFSAVAAAAFAYEGWIIATSINAELHNAKKNLPIALTLGTAVVAAIYILYFIGISGGASAEILMKEGAPRAFLNLFGKVGGTLLNIFVVVSCLGTLNGLMLACSRGFYSVAKRGGRKSIKIMQDVSSVGMPANSAAIALLITMARLVFWYGGIIRSAFLGLTPWWGSLTFDSSELPVITIYALYIPVFLMMMIKEKDFGKVKRFVVPILAIVACLFMMIVAYLAHTSEILWYLLVFAVIMIIGWAYMGKLTETE